MSANVANSQLIAVTVVGRDRPGIVAGVTEALFELGCNLEDVSSTILRGHFSMLMIVRAPDTTADRVEQVLARPARELGLVATARPVDEADPRVAPATHVVAVYGADQPGIVFKVARALAARGANITDLTSRVIGSDEEPVYALMLEISTKDPAAVERDLDALRDELGVEVTVHPAEPDLL